MARRGWNGRCRAKRYNRRPCAKHSQAVQLLGPLVPCGIGYWMNLMETDPIVRMPIPIKRGELTRMVQEQRPGEWSEYVPIPGSS